MARLGHALFPEPTRTVPQARHLGPISRRPSSGDSGGGPKAQASEDARRGTGRPRAADVIATGKSGWF
eukprot:scaffold17782_cov113-Isochrysis_galbana.AAC.4